FEAEDGIRDWSVTGVQTCALPILGPAKPAMVIPAGRVGLFDPGRCRHDFLSPFRSSGRFPFIYHLPSFPFSIPAAFAFLATIRRSEERRVGKECRSEGCAYA